MRLPRYRLRTLLVALAIAGLTLGIVSELIVRRDRFRELAADHASQVHGVVGVHENFGRTRMGRFTWLDRTTGEDLSEQQRHRIQLRNQWHHSLSQKYLTSAASPWLPVGPDPPEPE